MRLGPAATSWVIRAMRNPDPAGSTNWPVPSSFRPLPRTPTRLSRRLLVAAKDSDPGGTAHRGDAARDLHRPIRHFAGERVARTARFVHSATRSKDESQQVRLTAGVVFHACSARRRESVVSELDRALDGPDKALRVCAGDAMLKIDPERNACQGDRRDVLDAHGSVGRCRFDHYRLVQVLIERSGSGGDGGDADPVAQGCGSRDPNARPSTT